MAHRQTKAGASGPDLAEQHCLEGYRVLARHPLFAPMALHVWRIRREGNHCPPDGWAVVTSSGELHIHPTRRARPEEWQYVFAHCLLHLGLGHFQRRQHQREWNVACDYVVARLLSDLKLVAPPDALHLSLDLPGRSEEQLYQQFCDQGIPDQLQRLSTAGPHRDDMRVAVGQQAALRRPTDWQASFGSGLAAAVDSAVQVAGGYRTALDGGSDLLSAGQLTRNWFMSSYPLLGALAATFQIVEDPKICARLGISTAAVAAESKEIFLNPAAGLDDEECTFVMAHELLHVALRHHGRRQGRDYFLWNVACDYVINSWLVEMRLGDLPKIGALYDKALQGFSAEAIYDRIVGDMRHYRKLATLRGVGLGDMLEPPTPDWWLTGDGMDLDDFYRRCLSQGLLSHQAQERGYLPAGLLEEIRAVSQPPILWDVELSRWFDAQFAPLEKIRTYARPSRRQAATPDIPRPRVMPVATSEDGRTFGVLLDTSGSMDRILLAKALGAIAGYSLARDIPAVRVIFCDAATYDQGYLPPERIADRLQIKGRGGTVLQPAIDLLGSATDFPDDGPLLIITDGYCDRLRIRREHAFLLPEGHHLPFAPRGEVFRIR
ncbi:MAG: vWA domain-containing protein [Chloroflexota bacterium]